MQFDATGAPIAGDSTTPSTANSTQTPLGANETFTGEWERVSAPQIFAAYATNADGRLFFEFSHDGVTVDSTFPFQGFRVLGNGGPPHIAISAARFARVRLVNGDVAQTELDLYVAFGNFGMLNAPLNAQVKSDSDAVVTKSIDEISIVAGRIDGERVIPKQGFNPQVNTATVGDIWDGGGDYTGFTDAPPETFEVVSSSANDTAGGTGARELIVFYLDDEYRMFDDSGAFLTRTVALNGTSPVSLGVTGMRAWFAYVTQSGSSKSNEGDITIRWAATPSVVFSVIRPGYSEMLSTAFTVPAGYTGTIHRYAASMLDNTTNSASMCIKSERFGSNTYVQDQLFTISTENGTDRRLWAGRSTYPEKTNIVLRCTQIDNNNGIITGSYEIRLSRND